MRTELTIRKSASSSSEIDSISSSGGHSPASPAEHTEDDYSEGRSDATGATDSTDSTDPEMPAQRVVGPLCPQPVRTAIGIFSAMAGLTGMAMLIVGGMGLNNQTDPDSALDQTLAGGGGALMALGFFGACSTQLHTERRVS